MNIIQKLNQLLKEREFQVDESTYTFSYPYFVQFFQSVSGGLELKHIVQGAHMVYGWMPTILNVNTQEVQQIVELVNKARRGEALTIEQLELLKRVFNNSIVGTSKLLHFVSPELYPIWDSRICNALTGKSHQQAVNNTTRYKLYFDSMQSAIHHPDFEAIYVQKDYGVSRIRLLESILFQNGKEVRSNTYPGLKDVLCENLKVVFCGTAKGKESAKAGFYYAHKRNVFYKVLHSAGFTPYQLEPLECYEINQYGIGLTDLVPTEYGNDNEISLMGYDIEGFGVKMSTIKPSYIAFTSKAAASFALGYKGKTSHIKYGLHSDTIHGIPVFVLPSTSGSARAYWNEEYWKELNELVS